MAGDPGVKMGCGPHLNTHSPHSQCTNCMTGLLYFARSSTIQPKLYVSVSLCVISYALYKWNTNRNNPGIKTWPWKCSRHSEEAWRNIFNSNNSYIQHHPDEYATLTLRDDLLSPDKSFILALLSLQGRSRFLRPKNVYVMLHVARVLTGV